MKLNYVIITITALIFTCLVAVNFASPPKPLLQQENHAPVVKITKPKNDSTFLFNNPVAYNITISDKEDGDSRYGEINTKEVLLEVKYLDDASAATPAQSGTITDATGLALMRGLNCFNCHSFNSKGIGPSFYDIAAKYPASEENLNMVSKRVKDGSTGVWGKVSMPTHPELTYIQARVIVEWILRYAHTLGTDYYMGTTGAIRLTPPTVANAKGAYMLTASYIDHGIKTDSTKPRLEGSDVVIIRGK